MKSSQKSVKIKINQENYKNEDLINEVEESEDDNSTSKNLDDNGIISENPEIKKHQRCVPLEIYTKVYNDKQTLLSKVESLNKEINTLTSLNSIENNDDMKTLDSKCKDLEREKTNIENVLLNQENYVNKLKKKIEKLQSQIMKKNEEIMKRDNTITELNDKIEELNNKLANMKQNYKLAEKTEIMRLNEKISYLNNEVEIKQSKIDFIDKRHKNLQVKYLKLLGDKRKMTQENMAIFKFNKSENEREKDKLSDINSNSSGKYLDSLKTYNSMKKSENNLNKSKKMGNVSTSNKLSKDVHLPEIKNKNNKSEKRAVSLQKDVNKNNKKNIKNNALKDLNMLLSDYSEGDEEKTDKNEDMEDEDEYVNENNELQKDDENSED